MQTFQKINKQMKKHKQTNKMAGKAQKQMKTTQPSEVIKIKKKAIQHR